MLKVDESKWVVHTTEKPARVLETLSWIAEQVRCNAVGASRAERSRVDDAAREVRKDVASLIRESNLLLAGVDSVNGLTVVQPHDLANFKLALASLAGAAP